MIILADVLCYFNGVFSKWQEKKYIDISGMKIIFEKVLLYNSTFVKKLFWNVCATSLKK